MKQLISFEESKEAQKCCLRTFYIILLQSSFNQAIISSGFEMMEEDHCL